MTAGPKILDAYGRQAQLLPALIALLPIFLVAGTALPWTNRIGAGLLVSAIGGGLTVLLAHVARRLGRQAETRLLAEWGGKPTTIWLRHSDDHLDGHTKERYKTFLARRVTGWEPPTRDEEVAQPTAADERYDSAVRWLLEHARSQERFPRVFRENVSYGFRRNLYGLRPVGTVLALAGLVMGLAFLGIPSFKASSLPVLLLSQIVVSAGLLGVWRLVVDGSWVRDAGDAYAKELLATCEQVVTRTKAK